MKNFKAVTITFLVLAGLVAVKAAKADTVEAVNMNFASGATFNGNVTFASGFSSVTGVSGILNGDGVTNDPITWVWDLAYNYSSTPGTFGNFLMDGTGSNEAGTWTDYITFTYDYSAEPILTFSTAYPNGILSAYGGNNVVYVDPMISGSIGTTPEPSSYMLFGTGLLGLAFVMRRKIAQHFSGFSSAAKMGTLA